MDTDLHPPSLPFELVRQIMGYVGGPSTLRSCSLVCGLWHATSHDLLFKIIEIRDEHMLNAFRALLHSAPHIGPMVKQLHITAAPPNELKTAPWVRDLIISLSSPLTHVSRVHFLGWREDGYNCDEVFFKALSSFTSAKKVSFHACTLPHSVLTAIVNSFSGLTELSVHTSTFHRPRARSLVPPALRNPRLTSISVQTCEDALYSDEADEALSLAVSSSASTLRVAKLQVLPFGMRSVGRFLECAGPNLQHLELSIFHLLDCDPFNLATVVDLSSCQQLCSLNLGVHDRDRRLASSVISNMLARLVSPVLTRITIHVNFAGANLSEDYKTLIEEFKNPYLKRVEEISFVYEGSLSLDMAERKLRRAFTDLDSRGVMNVQCACEGSCSLEGYHHRICRV